MKQKLINLGRIEMKRFPEILEHVCGNSEASLAAIQNTLITITQHADII